MLEGGDGIVVAGGDEDDVAIAGDLLGHLDLRQSRHLDVEEGDARPMQLKQLQRLDAGAG